MRNIDSRNNPVTHDRFKPWPFPIRLLPTITLEFFSSLLELTGPVFADCTWVTPSLVGVRSPLSRVCCHSLSANGSGSMFGFCHHTISSPER